MLIIINLILYLHQTLKSIKMKKHNERNAGRKPKYNVTTKLVKVPLPILDKIKELSKPYLNIIVNKNNKIE